MYTLYVTKTCHGNFTNDSDPNSRLVAAGCSPYSEGTDGKWNNPWGFLLDHMFDTTLES